MTKEEFSQIRFYKNGQAVKKEDQEIVNEWLNAITCAKNGNIEALKSFFTKNN